MKIKSKYLSLFLCLILFSTSTFALVKAPSLNNSTLPAFSSEKYLRKKDIHKQLIDKLDSQQVQKILEKKGIAPGEAKERILAMSSSEIQQKMQEAVPKVGGDVIVIGTTTLLIAIIILLILD